MTMCVCGGGGGEGDGHYALSADDQTSQSDT